MRSLKLLALLLAACLPAAAAVETFKFDPSHSAVTFRVRHFFTPVPGSFQQFEGTITVDRDDLENSSVEAVILAASIDTGNEKRDDHLRSGDYFDVSQHPELTFRSTDWKQTGENQFAVTGDLTIHGVTKTVILETHLLGFGPGMRGAFLSGWEATTTIDRNDFGISHGSAAVGSDVEISITVEAVRQ